MNKTWEIKIEAPDEKSVLKYLKMITTTFELAVITGKPMNFISAEGGVDESKMICKLNDK